MHLILRARLPGNTQYHHHFYFLQMQKLRCREIRELSPSSEGAELVSEPERLSPELVPLSLQVCLHFRPKSSHRDSSRILLDDSKFLCICSLLHICSKVVRPLAKPPHCGCPLLAPSETFHTSSGTPLPCDLCKTRNRA